MSFTQPSERSETFLSRQVRAFVPALEPILAKLSRYTLVSVAALLLDCAVFQSLTMVALMPALAAVAGYLAGMALHYSLSVRFVFVDASAKSRRRTLFEFAVSGFIGLAITTGIVWGATAVLGLPPLFAKATAVVASFFAVFLLRSTIVFKSAV